MEQKAKLKTKDDLELHDITYQWVNTLGLHGWSIVYEKIDHEQVIFDCPPEDCYFIGVQYNDQTKIAIIFHDRNLTEEDIVHELLHVKNPDWSEDQVNRETKILLNQSKDDRWCHYSGMPSPQAYKD